ncbi:MAG: tRNA (adenosine(37)-N6)-threonylcarbamoyltransferase complex ATPase subunit type 1 TsaE [Flavobacteriales bacterium]|jgi:tRNA threonylcarbamoyladenosine biosynthesis protein TsaE|nr:tRNA (adenosine(37)-N6)-threonylcarbamoyltransferase complex ATPase subunit type 1 TsaE [Flavobacteriales bacterium]MBK6894585.1 tRNA (adenosine(37)-N6)-threonylcarbamoyltransferase complex ATPase subunit type 1 TsaE [Flavobacteriales bacterium]MBK7248736.1 tRNA (adenosine(37)-N6)-threonylcarbamoyltransferase complex ATPase subunit type 1 TsaE [Flavobacteriales bacterium]MBK7287627.1 tRNA (adenosine(37)-N6)-threonylcarbamoyltransferase complex ATPase subunit type 1 TsaE [Flavobacteriales bact
MSATLELRSPNDVADVAKALLGAYPDQRVFAFNGPMGVGKTTLIKALCEQLGVAAGMSSPSFSIVNEYRTAKGGTVYHFDLYRLNKPEELEGIGFTEYLDSGHYCFVEWPELGRRYFPPGVVDVEMRLGDDDIRYLDLNFSTMAPKNFA